MSFQKAVMSTPTTTTANGMAAFDTTMNPCVDLFSAIGAMRGKKVEDAFAKAYAFNAKTATQIALWTRDVRGGAGERQLFRDILVWLEQNDTNMLDLVLPWVPFYGRWDDLLVVNTAAAREKVVALVGAALSEKDGLCAKWMPRKGAESVWLRDGLGLTPKQYRVLLVSLTNVVETKMCAKEWDAINFSHVPSVAAARYQKAFGRNAAEAYATYKLKLASGDAKVNAGALYPYDVLKSISKGDAVVAQAQWDALPDFMGTDNILPMVDTSGSMDCPAGSNKTVTCMDVALSLGLYLSDKNKGAFKDLILTFSAKPELQHLEGNLVEKLATMRTQDWSQNTDIEAAFELVLATAVRGQVPQEDMPKMIVVLSDMQFDEANGGQTYDYRTRSYLTAKQLNATAMEMIRAEYTKAGYEMPQVVFWNLNASGNTPARFDESGVCLVSGFSPAIMTAIIGAKDFSPIGVMNQTLEADRYQMPWVSE